MTRVPPWFAVDEYPGEEALVEHAPDVGAAEAVDLPSLLEQVERAFKRALDVLADHLGCVKDALGLVEVALDAFLLLAAKRVLRSWLQSRVESVEGPG